MKLFKTIPIYILLLLLSLTSSYCQQSQNLKFGLDILMENNLHLLVGKRVGLITNQTGVDSKGNHIADLLNQVENVKLVALFSPEHGIRGEVEGGHEIDTQIDEKTGVPILSLYGKTTKPTSEMLQDIDILIFDIQDVGARFYTYISTMALAMEAAAENNIQFIILDHPNPITGTIIEGPVLKKGLESFVGIHPIALRHGMTIGELAMLFNYEGFLKTDISADLTVIKMQNWNRKLCYDQFNIKWIKPSPNMPDVTTAFLYPGIGLLEATNVSEGRGTLLPFKNIGAPWLNNIKLLEKLLALKIMGLSIDTTTFVPIDLPGIVVNPKYEDQKCYGLHFTITEPAKFLSVSFGVHLICLIKKLHPDNFAWRSPQGIDRMAGTDKFRLAVDSGISAEEIIDSWQEDMIIFQAIREKYLLYE